MSTLVRFDAASVRAFAESVQEGVSGAWFDPHAMAQTMLALLNEVVNVQGEAQRRLRDYDSITLALSILIEKSEGMSKKQVRQRLEEIYRGDR